MTNYKHGSRPTIGVLAGWQFYEGSVSGFLELVLHSIRSAAQECNLLFACGLGHAIGPVRLRPAWPVGSEEADFIPVGPWNTDGLIVINPLFSTERSRYIQEIRKQGHPVVFVGPGETGSSVVPDNRSGIHQAIAHLVQHGHHRIAFIAGYKDKPDDDSLERLQAYRAEVKEFGLENDPNLIVYGQHDFDGGRLAMKQLLGLGKPIQAVLASNDQSAFGAALEIRAANLLVPQDIALVGFDDTPGAANQEPPLTSVHYPGINVGTKALALLLELINDHTKADEIIHIPMRLIVRESCGCQPGYPITVNSDGAITTAQLVQSMAEAVRAETTLLNPEEIKTLCWQLVEAFMHSLQESDPTIFRKTFQKIRRQIELLGDDSTVWHLAISQLERNKAGFPIKWNELSTWQAEAMLFQARVDIGVSVRKQYGQYLFDKEFISDQIGLLTSQLFAAEDTRQLFETLGNVLPSVRVGQANIVFYEKEGMDETAYCELHQVPSLGKSPLRFPSRQFPPGGLFPSDKPFNLTMLPLLDQGRLKGFITFDSLDLSTCVTITRQMMAALRSVQLYQEAIESRRLAEDADRMKSRFLSTVSHELRTPLNLIVGLSNLVLQEQTPASVPLPPEYRHDLEQIHTNAEHLGRLVRDVLDLATSQAGQLRLEQEPLDLLETLQAALEAGEELARQKGLEWKIRLPETHPMVMGDRTRLRQVLLNLISNAVKFTESGCIEVRVETGSTEVRVSVQDTGLGIPVKEQAIIFDEFRQSERTTARGYGGMGLGLAISRRLVELHGGQIGVQSSGREGSGSTFSFSLPILEMSERPQAAGSPRVLLLAWHAAGSQLLRERLLGQGFEVELLLVGDDPDWAGRVVSASPSAVVVDSELAAGQGWEILKVLKSYQATRQVPVLFYSLSGEGDKGALLELDYLMKPLAQAELAQAFGQQGLASDGEGRKILVVDDEPGTLALHVRMVQSLSPKYEVLAARNGREALKLARERQPDLVLLDLMMPEMDGFGVLEAMRTGETTRDIPVVVLTAQILTEEDMSRLNRGVAAVLSKGLFSMEETLGRVQGVLGRQQKLGNDIQRLVRKAMAYLHTHFAEDIERETLAAYVGVNKNYLTQCFRRETGLTPFEYLSRYRINRAKAMLSAGDQSVGEVAEAVGFSSISYFNRVFQKEVKVSPGAYRRGQRNSNVVPIERNG